jgi:hypothetical protein
MTASAGAVATGEAVIQAKAVADIPLEGAESLGKPRPIKYSGTAH